jgi:GTP-binding protein EngB required for normal cell division
MKEKYLVFTGRPNSGKSSIIKKIVGLDVATGKHPGTTRKIKKYNLNHGLVLVDMPGFGNILGASKEREKRVNDQIIKFLESNAKDIIEGIHVLDISTFLEVTMRLEKKGFLSLDVEMVRFQKKIFDAWPLVAANKVDKTEDDKLKINLEEFIFQTSIGYPSNISNFVFPVSAKTGQGLGAFKNAIHEKLVKKGYRTPFKIN